jgi:hypothetical protein
LGSGDSNFVRLSLSESIAAHNSKIDHDNHDAAPSTLKKGNAASEN